MKDTAAAAHQELAGVLARAAWAVASHCRQVGDKLGITATQVVALRELSEPMTLKSLAHKMACEASNASYIVERMHEQGLIERREHPGDRRAKQVVLTAKGRSCRQHVLDELRASSPLNALSEREVNALGRLLPAIG
ncbi:MarR family winged helix-turn-helix transcriptional regulator [Nakamurella aerolata]|uniref:Winged helix DNA-binding protein n=1 Tax=Nakamurella aerolata TaxID=1656892 RepID=A0A849A6Z1_9ACTN|nr:MarR family transcriptional regulator [Nakamurella aerolata]NNG35406.1 winged helix DNA-binding protein [Nakamurella aerolata]